MKCFYRFAVMFMVAMAGQAHAAAVYEEPTITRTTLSKNERLTLLKSRPETKQAVINLKIPPTNLQKALAWAKSANPKESRIYTLHLKGKALAWDLLQQLPPKEYAHQLQLLKQQGQDQRDYVFKIAAEKYKAKPVSASWLSNTVTVAVTAGILADLITGLGIVDISPDVIGPSSEMELSYGGGSIRNGTLANELLTSSMNASQGHRGDANQPVRIAIIEAGDTRHPDWFWPGWQSATTGINRLREMYNCTDSGCGAFYLPDNGSSITGFSHSMAVTWLAAGSIEANQDPLVTNNQDQVQRSGMAPGSEIYVYRLGGGSGSVVKAIEQAIEDGVDIVNMSFSYSEDIPNTICNIFTNFSAINETIRNATEAGLLFVGSGGNQGPNACGIGYPNLRPEVIAVAPLNSFPEEAFYGALELHSEASAGGIPIWVSNEGLQRTAGITLVAPGCISFHPKVTPFAGQYADGSTGEERDMGRCASSMASPIIAGSAALIKHAIKNRLDGFYTPSANVPGRLTAALAVLGDKWNAANATNIETVGVNPKTGFGRIKLHAPMQNTATNPAGFAMGTIESLISGESASIDIGASPIEQQVQQFKIALLWYEDDYTQDVADIIVQLYDYCPANGGEPVEIASDWTFNMYKSITVRDADTLTGRCLRVKVTGLSVDDSRDVHYAFYFHSEQPIRH